MNTFHSRNNDSIISKRCLAGVMANERRSSLFKFDDDDESEFIPYINNNNNSSRDGIGSFVFSTACVVIHRRCVDAARLERHKYDGVLEMFRGWLHESERIPFQYCYSLTHARKSARQGMINRAWEWIRASAYRARRRDEWFDGDIEIVGIGRRPVFALLRRRLGRSCRR